MGPSTINGNASGEQYVISFKPNGDEAISKTYSKVYQCYIEIGRDNAITQETDYTLAAYLTLDDEETSVQYTAALPSIAVNEKLRVTFQAQVDTYIFGDVVAADPLSKKDINGTLKILGFNDGLTGPI